MPQKVFVAGSNGQLGKELTKQLKAKGQEYAAYDLPDLDIVDYKSAKELISRENPSVIINCAALTNVDGCELTEREAYLINGEGAGVMARIASELDIPIVHISTDYVFDGVGVEENGEVRPYIESDEINPQSVYGKSKAVGEKAVMDATDKHFIIRTAWLYGDGHNFVRTMIDTAHMIQETLAEAGDETTTIKRVRVVNDQSGSPTSTVDLAKTILALLDLNEARQAENPEDTSLYGVYHGTNEGVTTWYDFARKIFELAGIDIEVAPVSSEDYKRINEGKAMAHRPEYSVLENSRFKAENINLFRPWEEALEEYINGVANPKGMKGIILAGGSGTRLYPITKAVSKQLLPVFDKPMIYYPLSTLMQAGIREILVITTPEDHANFYRLLGDGSQYGLSLKYAVQDKPRGLAEAFIIAGDPDLEDPDTKEKFGPFLTPKDSVCLVLGDNIFYGNGFEDSLQNAVENALEGSESTIFGYWVNEPSRYGVVVFDEDGKVIQVEEKPEKFLSNYAIPGLYFFTGEVIEIANNVKPHTRSDGTQELEITSVIEAFMEMGKLKCEILGRGIAWLDTGTQDSLMEASNFVETIQKRQGLYIGCIEEIAFEQGYIGRGELKKLAQEYGGKNNYAKYLTRLSRMGEADEGDAE